MPIVNLANLYISVEGFMIEDATKSSVRMLWSWRRL